MRHFSKASRLSVIETTSVVAAALWYPYQALPQDRVTGWAATAYDVFGELAAADDAGVRLVPGTEVFHAPTQDPWWAGAVPDLRRVQPPQGYDDAWSFTAPVIDMPVYLRWLRGRLDELGATVTRMSLPALPQTDDVVVTPIAEVARRCFTSLDLTDEQAADVRFGRRLPGTSLPGERTAVFAPEGEFLALYRPNGDDAVAEAVFVG